MQENENDKAPLFRSWKGWYTAVFLFLLILIILFYLLTKQFS